MLVPHDKSQELKSNRSSGSIGNPGARPKDGSYKEPPLEGPISKGNEAGNCALNMWR